MSSVYVWVLVSLLGDLGPAHPSSGLQVFHLENEQVGPKLPSGSQAFVKHQSLFPLGPQHQTLSWGLPTSSPTAQRPGASPGALAREEERARAGRDAVVFFVDLL